MAANTAIGFSPAEVGEITGVSTSLQTEWRRQKILPSKRDRTPATWTLDETVWLFLLRELGGVGFLLTRAGKVATEALPATIATAHIASQNAKRALREFWNSLEEAAADAPEDARYFPSDVTKGWADQIGKFPPRYLLLSQQDRSSDAYVSHIVPASRLTNLPGNLTSLTALDNKNTARAILDGVSRCLSAREASK